MLNLKIVVCLTGASGIIYGIRLLEVLKEIPSIETFLVISEGGKTVLEAETNYKLNYVYSLANHVYEENDFFAPIASGSFLFDAVVIIPASMKTIAAIAHGYAHNLITRAADIALKQRIKLIVVPRETPLNSIHLENMLKLSRMGAYIVPACPGFYHKPKKIEDLINFIVGRVLDLLGIKHNLFKRWGHE